ncbi:MAG: ABC transporter permease [Planctomycetota bacterium]
MTTSTDSPNKADYQVSEQSPGQVCIVFSGDLTGQTIGTLWKHTCETVKKSQTQTIMLDVSAVNVCDGAGIGLLSFLQNTAKERQINTEIIGLDSQMAALLKRFEKTPPAEISPVKQFRLTESIGRETLLLLKDMYDQVAFFGRVLTTGLILLLRPWKFRWKDFFTIAENAGVKAVGIVAVLGLLFGLIMAFSSAMPLKQFGVEIYVADLVAIALVRVLGPFITAIIVAGRTGSAYAAELGTMKINNEIDALEVMNLDPVAFLVLPRVWATTVMTPLLSIAANLLGLIGAAAVILSLGYPLVTFGLHVQSILSVPDVLIGLSKALIYGGLIGTIGCLRGLQTQLGAGAVGISTTRAVVTSIILLVITEGVFSVLLYYLDI